MCIYIYIILILVCSFSSLLYYLYFSHIDCNAFYVERGIYLDAPLLTGMSLICSRRKFELARIGLMFGVFKLLTYGCNQILILHTSPPKKIPKSNSQLERLG